VVFYYHNARQQKTGTSFTQITKKNWSFNENIYANNILAFIFHWVSN